MRSSLPYALSHASGNSALNESLGAMVDMLAAFPMTTRLSLPLSSACFT